MAAADWRAMRAISPCFAVTPTPLSTDLAVALIGPAICR
jgi:hypothetical protein